MIIATTPLGGSGLPPLAVEPEVPACTVGWGAPAGGECAQSPHEFSHLGIVI